VQWCIAKNIGGYTLETSECRRCEDRGAESAEVCGVLGEGVSPPQPTRASGGAL